jgi:hypothetical protein
MSYDHWKTTEPESGYDPPEETADEANDRVCAQYEARLALLQRTAREIDATSKRYEAALLKIAGWQGYATAASETGEYEGGANDMLATLKQIAEEAMK